MRRGKNTNCANLTALRFSPPPRGGIRGVRKQDPPHFPLRSSRFAQRAQERPAQVPPPSWDGTKPLRGGGGEGARLASVVCAASTRKFPPPSTKNSRSLLLRSIILSSQPSGEKKRQDALRFIAPPPPSFLLTPSAARTPSCFLRKSPRPPS